MLTLVFLVLMFGVFGKILGIAIRMAWGVTKILFSIVFLPVILLALFFSGLVTIAIPFLILVGVFALLTTG